MVTGPGVHLSGGSLVRGFTCPGVHLSGGSLVRGFMVTFPGVHLSGVHLSGDSWLKKSVFHDMFSTRPRPR
jgi:hypothetical protein